MNDADPLARFVLGVCVAALLGIGLCVARLERVRPPRAPPLDRMGVVLTGRVRPGGLVVDSLSSDGGAHRAGVRVGDVVEAVNGAAARTTAEVERDLPLRNPVDFRIRRGHTSLHLFIHAPGNGFGQQDIAGRGRRVHG